MGLGSVFVGVFVGAVVAAVSIAFGLPAWIAFVAYTASGLAAIILWVSVANRIKERARSACETGAGIRSETPFNGR